MSPTPDLRPWYREPWPWLLMLPPLGAVIGGFGMLTLALGSPDALVVDDYARIEELTREQFAADDRASELELRAIVALSLEDGGRARIAVNLGGNAGLVEPQELNVRFRHAARADADRASLLLPDGATYAGEVALAPGRYTVELSPPDHSWRLSGLLTGVPATLELTPAPAAAQ